jgi:hypothetical protein
MVLRVVCIAIVLSALWLPAGVSAAENEKYTRPFQLQIEDYHQNLGANGGYPPYPVFVSAGRKQSSTGSKRKVVSVQAQKVLKGRSNQAAMRTAVLPKQFLGTWVVAGSRTRAVGGGAQYQAAINRVMPRSNQQDWVISGRPGAYRMNSTSGASSISVEQSTADTVFVRHRYRIGNCIAYESYVLRLDASGTAFKGMMNCNVSKPGEPPPPRFQAQYALTGHR